VYLLKSSLAKNRSPQVHKFSREFFATELSKYFSLKQIYIFKIKSKTTNYLSNLDSQLDSLLTNHYKNNILTKCLMSLTNVHLLHILIQTAFRNEPLRLSSTLTVYKLKYYNILNLVVNVLNIMWCAETSN